MYWKSFPTAIVLMFSLLAGMAAIGNTYIGPGKFMLFISGGIACALFVWAVNLHRNVIRQFGVAIASLHTMSWLGVLIVVFPNLAMMMLLYGGDLAFILAPLGLILLMMIAIYYLLPYWIFGEELFLDETVISPEGVAGILASVLVWTVLTVIVVLATSLCASVFESLRERGN